MSIHTASKPSVSFVALVMVVLAHTRETCAARRHVFVVDVNVMTGLGHVMTSWSKIYAVCTELNFTVSFENCIDVNRFPTLRTLSIEAKAYASRKCSSALEQMNVALFYEPARSQLQKKRGTRPDVLFVNGQDDWIDDIRRVDEGDILLYQPHVKYFYAFDATHHLDESSMLRALFSEPSKHLRSLAKRVVREMRDDACYHLRLFDESDKTLRVDETLHVSFRGTANMAALDHRMTLIKRDTLKAVVDGIIHDADENYTQFGRKTLVTVDSEGVRKRLRRITSIIFTRRSEAQDDMDRASEMAVHVANHNNRAVLDHYLLSLCRKIIVYPTSSTFSSSAAKRGGGEVLTAA